MREYTSNKTGNPVYVYTPGKDITGKSLEALQAWYAKIAEVTAVGNAFRETLCNEAGIGTDTVDIFLKHGGVHVTAKAPAKAKKDKGAVVDGAADIAKRFG